MNIPIRADDQTSLSFEEPTSRAGEWVCLKAEMDDLVVAFSACPQVCIVSFRGIENVPEDEEDRR